MLLHFFPKRQNSNHRISKFVALVRITRSFIVWKRLTRLIYNIQYSYATNECNKHDIEKTFKFHFHEEFKMYFSLSIYIQNECVLLNRFGFLLICQF